MKVLACNGPNLGRLGVRSPEIYGRVTLAELEQGLTARAKELGAELTCFQSESEAEIIRFIDRHRDAALILNPASLMINGWALREALADFEPPWVEVHISNVWGRESFRAKSITAELASGVIMGLGVDGYYLALEWLVANLSGDLAGGARIAGEGGRPGG